MDAKASRRYHRIFTRVVLHTQVDHGQHDGKVTARDHEADQSGLRRKDRRTSNGRPPPKKSSGQHSANQLSPQSIGLPKRG